MFNQPVSVTKRTRGMHMETFAWTHVLGIALAHVGCFIAPFYFTWSGLTIAVLGWWICGGIGICLGYHRLLTHRSFRTPKVVEYGLTLLGTTNWQGSPIRWVGTHRLHHRHSDHEHDPHTPEHGFNWSHVFWYLTKDPDGYDPRNAARDLSRDRVHVLIDRFHFLPMFIMAGVLFTIGQLTMGVGLSWVLWGCCVRAAVTYHATWFVNSASHTWGYRNYDTDDNSKNTWWVALLSFGEGWHNNHHASQRTARHGVRWFEIDMTYMMIKLMSWVGLATDIVPPKSLPQRTEAEPGYRDSQPETIEPGVAASANAG